jgi:hypothetical protein
MSNCEKFLFTCAICIVASTAFAQNIVNFDFGAVPIGCSNAYAYEEPTAECIYVNGDPIQNFNASPTFGWILGGSIAWHSSPPYPSPLLNGSAGLTGPNSLFNPPAFDGMPFVQAVFLQDRGSFVWQQIGGFNPGSYTLSFYLGSRYRDPPYDGNQTVVALVDGNVIGTWTLSSFTPFTLRSAGFTVSTGGDHTLSFMGTATGDHTAFISYVTITPSRQRP